MSKFLIIALGSIIFSHASLAEASAHRGGAELLNPKGYSLFAAGSIFKTSGYFDYEGTEEEMGEGNSYMLMDLDMGVSYGLSSNLELSGMARVRQVSSTIGELDSSNSGLESLGVLGKYAFTPIGKARYALGAYYRQTFYTNKQYYVGNAVPVDELVLGDSGREYGVNFYLTYLASPVKWDFLIGYKSPGNSLSEEIIYKGELLYRFSELSLFGGVEGISSLKKDQFGDAPTLKPIQAVGASRMFNSVNREKMAPYIGANYAFEKLLVTLKGQTVMAGQSTDKGNLVMLSLDWTSGGVTKESVKIDSFKEYNVEGAVLKVSARGNFIKIDQGLSTDVEKGMKFDIYQTDYFGGNVLVASGVAYDVGADWSIIKLTKKFKEIEIKPGFAARGH